MSLKSSILEHKISMLDLQVFFQIIYCSFFLLFSFIAFSFQRSELFALWCLVAPIYLCFLLKKNRGLDFNINVVSVYIVSLVIASFIALPFSIFHGLQNVGHFYVLVLSLLLSYILSRDAKILFWSSRITIVFIQMYILGYVMTYVGDSPMENIIPGASYNGISSYIIILQCSYSIISWVYNKSFAWVTSAVTMYLCFISIGRGAVVSGLMLVFFTFVFWFLSLSNKKKTFITFLLLLGGGSVIWMGIKNGLILSLFKKTKLVAGFVSGERLWMWQDYWRELSTVEFFFGRNFKGLVIGEFFNGNPHSSFVRGHSKFGFLYTLLVIIGPFICMFLKRKRISMSYGVSLVLIMFFRALTEPILFPTILDIYFYSALFFLCSSESLNSQTRV